MTRSQNLNRTINKATRLRMPNATNASGKTRSRGPMNFIKHRKGETGDFRDYESGVQPQKSNTPQPN